MSNSVTKIPKDGVQLSEHCTCILYDMYQCQGTAAQATFSPMLCKPLGTSWRMLTKKPFYTTAQTPCIYYIYATKKRRQVWQNAFQLTQSFSIVTVSVMSGWKVNCQNMLALTVAFGKANWTHFYGWNWRCRTIRCLTNGSGRDSWRTSMAEAEEPSGT